MNGTSEQQSGFVVGAGSLEGRVYVVEAGEDRPLQLTPRPAEARRFDTAQDAERLVAFLKAHPHGREPHWTVFPLGGRDGLESA